MSVELKSAVSVAEMARMVGLSRQRFYQLIGTAFPFPVYCVFTRRPFYDEIMQNLCLEVRRRNCGIDGRPVLFYCRRPANVPAPKSAAPSKHRDNHADLIDGLQMLGMAGVNIRQIDAAVREVYPKGTGGVEESELLRTLFLHLKRQNSGENVGIK